MARESLKRLDKYIGKRLKQLRESRGLNQEAVGELLEVSLQQISRFENNKHSLSAAQLYQLARGLDVPMSWFSDGYKESDEEKARLKTFLKRDLKSWRPGTDQEEEQSLLVAFRRIATKKNRDTVIQVAEGFVAEK